MSSPNAAGCVAVLISASKAETHSLSPYKLIRAIKSTGNPVSLDDGFKIGFIQVEKAWEWLKQRTGNEVAHQIGYDVRVITILTFFIGISNFFGKN